MTTHLTPESLTKTIQTHASEAAAAGTVDAPATDGIDNGLYGAEVITFHVNHETIAAAHSLTLTVLHKDPGGAYAAATDAAGNTLTLAIAAATAAGTAKFRVRASRLKRHIQLRATVAGASTVNFGADAILWGLDRSSDADGIAGYDVVDLG